MRYVAALFWWMRVNTREEIHIPVHNLLQPFRVKVNSSRLVLG